MAAQLISMKGRSRRGETASVAAALARHRPLALIEAPATLDGGDVLVAGTQVFVGRSSRTNGDAVAQLRRLVAPFGYTVCEVDVRDCLHLKSAATAIADDGVLINPAWIDRRVFADVEFVDVDPDEAMAANALRLHDRVIYPTAFPRTGERLVARGLRLALVDASEVAKAEGAVTCCSLIFKDLRDG